MNNKKKFVPVMLTPFREDGRIDFNGLTRLTDFYLNNGAQGLFANCQSSEMFALTPDERLNLVAHVLSIVDGKVPVVATGNFGDTLEAQASFVRKVYALGVQAVILLTNQLVKQDEPEAVLEANILRLLELTANIPLGFYECPEPYKVVLSPQLLGRVVSTGRIIYHKDTCLDIEQVKEKNRLSAGVKDFALYDAYMAHAVESLKSGSVGLSCIQGNYFPELVVWLCDNYDDPAMEKEVALVQQFFIDEMEVMHRDYPQSAKYYLLKKGILMSSHTRKSKGNEISYKTMDGINQLELRYSKLLGQLTGTKVNIGKIV
ncbi:dihydrodipicolinate synthase family protein [Niabella aurantiaca]|uniref:dihydrodipicolinate synthase family protein n=1 Tax=Niabella aurantiaca TaxID=379900 RepID=UPI00036502F6|nr:dihydrodipicolinate synthase family protein [Niabella aurantiaca]